MNHITTGFVILPRLTFKNRFDQALYSIFMEEANFATNDYLKRGQAKFKMSELSEELHTTRNMVRNSITRLEKDGLIKKEPLPQNKGILVTIINYDEYQSLETYQKSKESKIEPPKKLVQLMGNETNPFNQIENKFIQQRAAGLVISASDAQSINEVLKLGIPLETLLEWMDTIYEHYIKRNNGRTIRTFKYYEEAIKTQQQKLQQPKTNVTPFPKPKKENSIDALARFAQKHGVKLGGTQDGNT